MSLCWDNDKMEMAKEDSLQFLRMVFIDPNFFRLAKLCSFIFLIFHVPLWALQYYNLFQSFDIIWVAQYGPTALIMAFGFMALLILLFYEKTIKELLTKLKEISWSLNCCSETTHQEIMKVCAYFTYDAKINLVLGALTYICLLLRHRANKQWEIFYQVSFFEEKLPKSAHILTAIFYASLIYLFIPMASLYYVFTYLVLHLNSQSAMVLDRIEKITENFTEDIRLADNDFYQRQVFQRLGFCFNRYTQLRRFSWNCLERTSSLLVIYFLVTIVFMFFHVGTWYMDPDKYYPLLFMSCFLSLKVGLLGVDMGHRIEKDSERYLETLISLPWYTFNMKNQRSFLLFIGYASKPITATPYESIAINRRAIVQFYKIFSSMCAVLANLNLNNWSSCDSPGFIHVHSKS